MELTIKQTIALDYLQDNKTTELIFGGGAGGGKSILGAYWVLKMCLKYPFTRWVIGRNSLKTLKETTLNSFWNVCKLQNVKNGQHFKYNEVRGIATFINGSEIMFKDLAYYPSDPNFDELGSLEITGAFVDECNQITEKAWLVLKSRIRHKLDENGLVPKILGTCNPSKNWVYVEYYTPYKHNELQPHRKFVQSLIDDNNKISKHYRDNLLTLDKTSKERLLFGNWEYDDDVSVLCEYDSICDVFTNEHVKPTGVKRVSADLAMQGRDKFIAAYWDGLVCKIAIDQPKSTGKSIEADLKKLIEKNGVSRSNTIVDSDGLGAYLESYLEGIKEFHGGAAAIHKLEFANLKAECAYKLAEFINDGKLKIICTPEQRKSIIEELSVLKSESVDKDETKKRIIKKEVMKELIGHSPDYLDVLIMGMWYHCAKPLAATSVYQRR